MHFSVVIPLFNKEDYILRAVRSVLEQTHRDLELIVVDDGSSDRGADRVASLEDSRVRLIRQPNGGASSARNAGVLQARAEWVAFLDADDEYGPRFLEEVDGLLRSHPDADLSMVGANYYYPDQGSLAVRRRDISGGIHDFFDVFGDQKSPSNSSTTVVHRGKFRAVGGYPEGVRHFEDWMAYFKLACVGFFGYIPEPMGIFHEVPGSVTVKMRPRDYFKDAIYFPEVVRDSVMRYGLSRERRRKAMACANEFAVNIAAELAREGEKAMALKMMSRFRPAGIRRGRLGRWRSLLLQLAVPQAVKRRRK